MDLKISTICFVVGSILFFCISKVLFDNVYITSNTIVDEVFHLPLGEAYCKFKFDTWDPKVTTLPGLYLLSALILGPFKLCSDYWLRAISFGFSFINLFLFYILFSKYAQGDWRNILSSVTLSLLPPLYFFSHVYYTDVVSLTMILSMVIFNEKGYHYFSSVFGFLAVICRQNNIIIVGIYAGKYVLSEMYTSWLELNILDDKYDEVGRTEKRVEDIVIRKEEKLPAKNLIPFASTLIFSPGRILRNTTETFWYNLSFYLTLAVSFLVFVILNGGIVVGDKSAHQVTVHIPQLFYFTLFCLIFGWPHFVGEVLKFMVFARKHKILTLNSLLLGFLIVHFNTQVHPYLIADNRHYIFYVWTRFYSRYAWFKYAMVPVYVFGIFVIVKKAWNKNDVGFALIYIPATILLLCTQKLIDVRYYIVPYILLRLRLKNTDSAVFNVVLECVTFCVMNMITFNIFFTKSFKWDDWACSQRIIW